MFLFDTTTTVGRVGCVLSFVCLLGVPGVVWLNGRRKARLLCELEHSYRDGATGMLALISSTDPDLGQNRERA